MGWVGEVGIGGGGGGGVEVCGGVRGRRRFRLEASASAAEGHPPHHVAVLHPQRRQAGAVVPQEVGEGRRHGGAIALGGQLRQRQQHRGYAAAAAEQGGGQGSR